MADGGVFEWSYAEFRGRWGHQLVSNLCGKKRERERSDARAFGCSFTHLAIHMSEFRGRGRGNACWWDQEVRWDREHLWENLEIKIDFLFFLYRHFGCLQHN